MEDKIVIYAAGNPDAYPLEYYDEFTQSYQGIIPELFRSFSEQSRYEIIYYQPDGKDHREQLGKNNQVDLLSGYAPGERVPSSVGSITLFQVTSDGTEQLYPLYITAAAPASFSTELEGFLASVSQSEISGILLNTAVAPMHSQSGLWLFGSLLLALVLLATALLVGRKKYRKHLKKAQNELETDKTTGLANMEHLSRYYDQFISDQNRILYQLFYFHVDTDRLRCLTSGEETNEFLHFCAVVLQEQIGHSDLLASVSEQGFVLLKLTGSNPSTGLWLSSLLTKLRNYPKLYDKPFDVSIHVGIYPLELGGRDLDELIFHARHCARSAALNDEDYEICSRQVLQKGAQDKLLQAHLQQAFDRHEFQLYIQFYVDAQNFRIVGGEALSRWNHPQKGLLLPGDFIPLMEGKKAISRLDYYGLQEVCDFLEDLYAHHIDTFFVSCNFSRTTFSADDFVTSVKEIVNAYSFPRELLIFELTESASVPHIARIQQNAMALKEYGVRIALDDFGEGFTSFFDLQKYPIDGLKLDKSLVDSILTPTGNAILKAMVQLGHDMDMTILAEGVESESQVLAAQQLHCDVIQGFYFHIPLPSWEAKHQILKQGPIPPV